MMRKQSLLTTLLAAAVLTVSPWASAGTWDFSYQGFVNAESGQFDPNMKFSGSFSGEDGNGNGIIEAAELSYLSIAGTLYRYTNADHGCDPDLYRLQCSLDRFSYTLTGQLAFSAGWSIFRSGDPVEYATYVTGDYIATGVYFDPNERYETRYLWSDQTVFTITPPPVPEPAAAMLWLGGAGVVAAALRRRRGK